MMPQQGPTNVDYIRQLTNELEAALNERDMFKWFFSQVAVHAMDAKGRVRIPVPEVNLAQKINTLNFNQTQNPETLKFSGLRIDIEFVEGTRIPKSKQPTPPKPKGKGKKK